MKSSRFVPLILGGIVFMARIQAGAPEGAAPRPAKPPTPAAVQAPAATPPVLSTYELSGFFGTGSQSEVSLRKRGSERAEWVRVGEKFGELTVESADPKLGIAVVRVAGGRYRLYLRSEKITVEPAAAPTPVAAEAPPAKPVVDELTRRRELRKRMQAIEQNMTPEQNEVARKLVNERMHALVEKYPAMKNSSLLPVEAVPEMTALVREAFVEAYKLPCKDGSTGTVPADLDEIMMDATKPEPPPVEAEKATSP